MPGPICLFWIFIPLLVVQTNSRFHQSVSLFLPGKFTYRITLPLKLTLLGPHSFRVWNFTSRDSPCGQGCIGIFITLSCLLLRSLGPSGCLVPEHSQMDVFGGKHWIRNRSHLTWLTLQWFPALPAWASEMAAVSSPSQDGRQSADVMVLLNRFNSLSHPSFQNESVIVIFHIFLL